MPSLDKPDGNKRFLSWFGFVMVLIYIALGLYFLIYYYFFTEERENIYQAGIGWLLIIYGMIRAYRVFINFKSKDDFTE